MSVSTYHSRPHLRSTRNFGPTARTAWLASVSITGMASGSGVPELSFRAPLDVPPQDPRTLRV